MCSMLIIAAGATIIAFLLCVSTYSGFINFPSKHTVTQYFPDNNASLERSIGLGNKFVRLSLMRTHSSVCTQFEKSRKNQLKDTKVRVI